MQKTFLLLLEPSCNATWALTSIYIVCHGFRLAKQVLIFESILTSVKLGIVFGGSWGSTENWLEPET